jgi:hypothetical protein
VQIGNGSRPSVARAEPETAPRRLPGETGGGHGQRKTGETAYCGANLFDSECGRFRCWPNIGFNDSDTGTARRLLDTRNHRDQLRFVSAAGMVHSPIYDDAFHPGPPGSLITTILAFTRVRASALLLGSFLPELARIVKGIEPQVLSSSSRCIPHD